MAKVPEPFRRTEVRIDPVTPPLFRKDRMVWMGSCFAESMGPLLERFRYTALLNPLGVGFNPLVLERWLHPGLPFEEYSFEKDGVWLNYLFGHPFAASGRTELENTIRQALEKIQSEIKRSRWLVLTWGTAFGYYHRELDLVGKCHKQPGHWFQKKIVGPPEIVEVWKKRILELRQQNPGLRVVLTVSPVRHTRDGLVENSLSKATLRVAADTLQKHLPEIYYFPAFELITDELREYRFFGPDLVHPNEEAIGYIWASFIKAFADPEEQKTNEKLAQWHQLDNHRPLVSFGKGFTDWQNARSRLEEELAERLRKES